MTEKINNILTLCGISAGLILLAAHLLYGNVCPLFAGVPACFFVLIFFMALYASESGRIPEDMESLVYYTFSSAGFLMAVWFSYREFLVPGTCPRLANTPLCYISALVFGLKIAVRLFKQGAGEKN
ncbi:MAG: hypothetical protein ACLFQK_02310 [Fibrobacterota bacterium]